jgi:hypothetical protein
VFKISYQIRETLFHVLSTAFLSIIENILKFILSFDLLKDVSKTNPLSIKTAIPEIQCSGLECTSSVRTPGLTQHHSCYAIYN